MKSVAVVGLGAMGSRIAQRLLDAGYPVLVWNRTAAKAEDLVGAAVAASPADATRRSDAVITMVADPPALRAVTEGPEGIAVRVGASTTVIEMSTVGAVAVARLSQRLPPGARLLDAPVLGSLAEAEAGTLRIFVGGPESLFEEWIPLLSVLGSPLHVGPLGSGAAAKLVANTTLFGTLGVLGEALALADGLGLSRTSRSRFWPGRPWRRRPSGGARRWKRTTTAPLLPLPGAEGRRPGRRGGRRDGRRPTARGGGPQLAPGGGGGRPGRDGLLRRARPHPEAQ